MYKIYTTALAWLNGEPTIAISDDMVEAPELSMRFAETFAEKGFSTVLVHETGNPDLPEEVIHYVPSQFVN